MSTYTDFLASKKEARAAKVKRDASILALENTCARFNSITSENAIVRIFTQIENEYGRNLQALKDDNVTFTYWILHASTNFKDDSAFIADQKTYNKACLDAMTCREKIYVIIESKGLFPEVKPHVIEEGINLATILEKLAAVAKKDREVHALAMKNASLLAAEAAKAQTAALVKLKPAGIKLTCNKFDGGKYRHQYKQWYTQFTAMIEASGVEDNRVKLSQLVTHLVSGGLALKLIAEFEITEDNYAPAIAALEKEFLDKDKNKKELLQQILSKTPSYDTTFESTRIYLSELKFILINLQKHYQVDLLKETDGGFHLMGVDVFNKLPTLVQRGLITKINTNHPTLK